MKNLFLLLFCLILLSCTNTNNQITKIGVITPLTGYASLPGQMCLKGIKMAEKQFTSSNKPKYEFIIEDCKSSPKDAIAAYKRLYSMGIKYYIVCGGQFAMSIAPQTANKDVIMFATATANIDLLSATNRCFRMFPHPHSVIETLSNYTINDLKSKKVAIVFVQNEAYALYANLYENAIKENGGEVVLKEGYATTQRDFKDIITKVINSNPDYLYLSGMGESALIFSKQLFANPSSQHIPILGDMNFALPNVTKVIGNFSSPIYYVDATISNEFETKYIKEYNEKPNAYSYYPYIIPFIIDEAKNHCHDKKILSEIDYIKQHEFLIASDKPIQFDSLGEVNLTLKVNVINKSDDEKNF